MSVSIQKVQAQLKRLSFGREWALTMGPLREYPRVACAQKLTPASQETGGCLCRTISRQPFDQIQ